jgi:hypothetical protein
VRPHVWALLVALIIRGPSADGGFLISFPVSSSSITGLTLSGATYTSSVAGTLVGNLVLSGSNNSTTTFALSGPDAGRFQLSAPCPAGPPRLEAPTKSNKRIATSF